MAEKRASGEGFSALIASECDKIINILTANHVGRLPLDGAWRGHKRREEQQCNRNTVPPKRGGTFKKG